MDIITQRHRSLVCSQITGRKGPDAVRGSVHSRNYKTGGICRQQYPLIQIARTQKHINSAVLQTARHLKTELQRGTGQINDDVAKKTKERWLGKRMLGHFSRDLD